MFIAIIIALLINNLILYFIVNHAIDWKILRIVEEMIKVTNELINKNEYDVSKLTCSISEALNNSIGSKHDRSRSSH